MVHSSLDAECCSHTKLSYKVVATGVANVRQGIILTQDSYVRLAVCRMA